MQVKYVSNWDDSRMQIYWYQTRLATTASVYSTLRLPLSSIFSFILALALTLHLFLLSLSQQMPYSPLYLVFTVPLVILSALPLSCRI